MTYTGTERRTVPEYGDGPRYYGTQRRASEYDNLRRWTLPGSYGGAHWHAYYSAGVGQSRDSDALEQSNFACMLRALGGESETVHVVHERHWAVGWVEWIAIHESNTVALTEANELAGALEDYPVLDESDLSEREWADAQSCWENMRVKERVELCRKAHVSIFAARRDYIPQEDSGIIFDYCRS